MRLEEGNKPLNAGSLRNVEERVQQFMKRIFFSSFQKFFLSHQKTVAQQQTDNLEQTSLTNLGNHPNATLSCHLSHSV